MLTKRKSMAGALGALFVVGTLAGLGFSHGRDSSPVSAARAADVAPAAAEVDVAVVISRTITDWQDYTRRLEAVDHVDVRPLVPGTIVAVHFKDGALVKKGDVLLRSTRVRTSLKSIVRLHSSPLRRLALRMPRPMRLAPTDCSPITPSRSATTTKSRTQRVKPRQTSRPRSQPRNRKRKLIMNISKYFIDRPIFAGVLSVVILLAGIIALTKLPTAEYPEVVPPSVVVRAQYPGANPKVIAETVASPIE
jgi:hypothetical protein